VSWSSVVIVRLALDFLAEITWPSRVDIRTRIAVIGRSSTTLDHALFQNGLASRPRRKHDRHRGASTGVARFGIQINGVVLNHLCDKMSYPRATFMEGRRRERHIRTGTDLRLGRAAGERPDHSVDDDVLFGADGGSERRLQSSTARSSSIRDSSCGAVVAGQGSR
jgi:hypothetical protein